MPHIWFFQIAFPTNYQGCQIHIIKFPTLTPSQLKIAKRINLFFKVRGPNLTLLFKTPFVSWGGKGEKGGPGRLIRICID